MAYPSHGASCYYRGDFEEAERHLLTGVDITAKINMSAHNAMAHQYLGHVYFERGRYRKAQDHYRNAIRVRRESRLFPSSVNLNTVALARARVAEGAPDIDLEQICRYAGENRVKVYEGAIARYIAEICLKAGEVTRAAGWIETAIETDERNHMRCDQGWDHALHAECLRAADRPEEASASLQKAISIFQSCGADGWAQRTKKRLATV
jgi:tetratricopeptide (TPR) repeat protein